MAQRRHSVLTAAGVMPSSGVLTLNASSTYLKGTPPVRSSAAALLDNVLISLVFFSYVFKSLLRINMNTMSLLTGLRFIDSFFPSGGYAYSS